MRAAKGLFGLALPLLLGGFAGPDTPVADAAQRGDVEAVRQLLRQGADVNAAQGDGMTALHWAAHRGDAALGEVLVYAGADVDAGTRIGGYTPLHVAAREASLGMVELLLRAKANPRATTTNSGASPLHLASASGNAGIVAALVAAGADVDARESAWGQTPLIFAAAANRAEAIRALLEAGADPGMSSRAVDVAEQEAADRAAEKRLGEFLADFRGKEGGGTDWQPTPSQVQAAIQASREIQRRWPDVPDPDAEEADEGEMPEEPGDKTAGDEGPTDEKNDDPDGVSADAGDAVQEPAKSESEDTAAAEPKSDAEPSEEEPKPLTYGQLVGGWGGLTPLLHAVRQGNLEATFALLRGGADINQPSAGDSTTPLLMATVNGQFDLALILLEKGADPNAESTAGTTPLFAVLERTWAPRASYAHPTEHLQQHATHIEVMHKLLEAGADPNVRLKTHLWYMEYTFGVLRGSGINLMGATPFWRAAYALDVEAMRVLKAYGADPDIPTMKPPQRRRRPMADEEEKPKEEDKEEPVAEGAEEEAAEPVAEYAKNPTKGNAEGESSGEEEERPADEDEDKDHSGVPPVPVFGPAIYPIHAASGVGYGQSFAGNAHRYVRDNWLAAVKFLVEECGADVNVRDANAYSALHHAASRGDNDLVRYLVEKGADVTVVSRKGQTTADMANGPVQRVQPFPETVALLESLGSKNNNKCVSC